MRAVLTRAGQCCCGVGASLLVAQALGPTRLHHRQAGRQKNRVTCVSHRVPHFTACQHTFTGGLGSMHTARLSSKLTLSLPAPLAPLLKPSASESAPTIARWICRHTNRQQGRASGHANAGVCCAAVHLRSAHNNTPAASHVGPAAVHHHAHEHTGLLKRTCSHSSRPLGPILCFFVAILLSHCHGARRLSSLSDMSDGVGS